jgi:hypothetical protein
MRVTLDLFRAADGRLEGAVYSPGGHDAPFAGVLDLLRVLEGLDLAQRGASGADEGEPEGADGRSHG